MAAMAGLSVRCPLCPRRVSVEATAVTERDGADAWMVVELDTRGIRDHLHEHQLQAEADRARQLEPGVSA